MPEYTSIRIAMKDTIETWEQILAKLPNETHKKLAQECFELLLKVDQHMVDNACKSKKNEGCYEGLMVIGGLSMACLSISHRDEFAQQALVLILHEAIRRMVHVAQSAEQVKMLVKAMLSGNMEVIPIRMHGRDFMDLTEEIVELKGLKIPDDQPPCPDCGEVHPTREQVLDFLKTKAH